jgi:hypothetical protein
MPWGKLELESEVEKWFLGLNEEEQGRVQFYFDLLEEKGVLLDRAVHASAARQAP